MEIVTYAPVLITTLNRYEHFVRCLESLERCTGADKTDVHVALDYPPSDKYKEGWSRIDQYLKEKEAKNGFKNLFVYRRDHNYGVCHVGDNFETLIADVSRGYDRYITSEDDNEFAPCFLQYMNKALERFFDDERVFLVCGYNYQMVFPEMYRNNFYLTKYGCPWGTGSWTHKDKKMNELTNGEKLRSLLQDDRTYKLLKRRSMHSINSIVSMLKNNSMYGDAVVGVYNALYDCYCLLPRESMVRNWGNDGTGEHNKRRDADADSFYNKQSICNDADFEFTNDIFSYEPLYLERQHYHPKKNINLIIKALHSKLRFRIDLFLLRHFNFVPKSKLI